MADTAQWTKILSLNAPQSVKVGQKVTGEEKAVTRLPPITLPILSATYSLSSPDPLLMLATL
jgi:hypothetical protein